MSNRFQLINYLNAHDKFRDNENKEDLDSFDVTRILNHYDKTLTEFVKRDNEQQNKITDLEAKLADKDKEIKKLKQLVKAIDTYNQYSNDAKNLIILNPDNCYTNGHKIVLKTNDQDKIDYAVEQLSYFKVLRGLVLNMRMTSFEEYRDKIPMKYLAIIDAHIEKLADIVDDQVDSQIKQLKEVK